MVDKAKDEMKLVAATQAEASMLIGRAVAVASVLQHLGPDIETSMKVAETACAILLGCAMVKKPDAETVAVFSKNVLQALTMLRGTGIVPAQDEEEMAKWATH